MKKIWIVYGILFILDFGMLALKYMNTEVSLTTIVAEIIMELIEWAAYAYVVVSTSAMLFAVYMQDNVIKKIIDWINDFKGTPTFQDTRNDTAAEKSETL